MRQPPTTVGIVPEDEPVAFEETIKAFVDAFHRGSF